MGRPAGVRGQQGAGRQRALEAAIELFRDHGVGGTSLQMIADRVGVTKGAISQQFGAKENIGLALLAPVVVDMQAIVERARCEATPTARSAVAVLGVIDLVVDHRHVVAALFRDPVLESLVGSDPHWAGVLHQLDALVDGPDPDEARRVALAVFTAGLASVVVDPRTARLGDDALRDGLRAAAARLLGG